MTTENYLVDFINSATDHEIALYLNNNNLSIVSVYDNFEKIYLVSATTQPPADDIVESIINDSQHKIKLLEVKTSQLFDVPLTLNLDSEQDWWKTACLMNINWENDTQTIVRAGNDVVVYLLDSGVKTDHPDFDGANVHNSWSFTEDYIDTTGHGTALASVIVGRSCGITDSTLKSVKIFDEYVPTRQSDMLAAFDFVISDHVANNNICSIVNLSWSISKNEYIESKINQLLHRGIYIICAAGNSGHEIGNVTPAGMTGVIKVGSFGQNLTPSNFSDYEDSDSFLKSTRNIVNIPHDLSSEIENSINNTPGEERQQIVGFSEKTFGWAPGEQIWTAKLDDSYGFIFGTSISAAIATACLAYNVSYTMIQDFTDNDIYLDEDQRDDLHIYRNVINTRIVFVKPGLIELTEEYSFTNSHSVGIISDGHIDENSSFNGEYLLLQFYNEHIRKPIYNKNIYNSVEYTTLPPGLKIDNGFLYGMVEAPPDNRVTQYQINLVLRGPTVEEKTETYVFTFATDVDAAMDSGLSPSIEDPTLDIQLLVPLCGTRCSYPGYLCSRGGQCFKPGCVVTRCITPCRPHGGALQANCFINARGGNPGPQSGHPFDRNDKNACNCYCDCSGIRSGSWLGIDLYIGK